MPERFDVAIVGGGPAGSSCAWRLRHSGARVVVFDRETFPRDKSCAGWISPGVFSALGVAVEEYAPRRVLQPIVGFRTGLMGGGEIETRYERVVSYGVRRREFDAFLLQRCGAELRTGQPVRSLVRSDGRWRINESCEAALLVGAGGTFCPVARLPGAREAPRAPLVISQQIEWEAAGDDLAGATVAADVPELFFCEDLRGYGWCIRKGPFLNIGLGRIGGKDLPARVASFVRFLRDRGKLVGPVAGRFRGHAYRLCVCAPSRLSGEGFLLAGDAAGLAHPKSGAGIQAAVDSGLIAAAVILQAGTGGSRAALESYPERIAAHFRAASRAQSPQLLPRAWLNWCGRRLLSSRRFTRRVVLDRWFLS